MDEIPSIPPPRNGAVQIAGAYVEAWFTRWPALLSLVGLAWIGGAVAQGLYGLLFGFDTGAFLGVLGLDIVPTAFFTAAAAHVVLWDWRPGLREALNVASRAFVMMLAVLALYRLAILLGFALLVIPGLIIMFMFTLAPVLVMAVRPSVPEAFLGSWRLIKDHVPDMIGGYMVFLLACVGGLIIGGIVAAIATAGLEGRASEIVGSSLFFSVLSILHVTFAASAYKVLADHDGSGG